MPTNGYGRGNKLTALSSPAVFKRFMGRKAFEMGVSEAALWKMIAIEHFSRDAVDEGNNSEANSSVRSLTRLRASELTARLTRIALETMTVLLFAIGCGCVGASMVTTFDEELRRPRGRIVRTVRGARRDITS